MLFSVEQAFVGREEIRAPLKTPAWEASVWAPLRRNVPCGAQPRSQGSLLPAQRSEREKKVFVYKCQIKLKSCVTLFS